MNDQTQSLRKALSQELGQADLELVDIVPVPLHRDRLVRIQTLEEILDEFDKGDDATQGYFVQLRQKPAAFAPVPREEPSPELTSKPNVEGIYLPNGKLNTNFLMRNAEILLSAGDFSAARHIYKTILQSGERTSIALAGMAHCFEGEGKFDEARINYEESIAYHATLDTYHRLSNLLIRQGKDGLAAEVLERALNLRDLRPDSRFELHKASGNCWTRARKIAEAENHYRRALQINPSADEIQSNLGALYLQEGKTADAKRHFQDAISSNPKNDRALSGLGSCHFAEGSKQAAHDFFAKSLQLELKNPTAIFYLVKCAFELKTYATAANLVEQYVESAPVNVNLMYSLAGLQFHLGRMDAARRTTQRILEIQPSHAGALDLMGRIGRFAEARA